MSKHSLLTKIGTIAASAALLTLGMTPVQAAGPPPNWRLPFQNGQSWKANAPHDFEGEKGSAAQWGSIDFGPQNGAANRKVVSIAAGKVYKISCSGGWYLGVDHGNGWKSTYYHLTSQQSGLIGKTVPAGTWLGDAGNATPCGGKSYAPHVHLTILKDNAYTNVNNFKFGNYRIVTGSETYVGKWVDAKTGALVLNVPRPGYMVGALRSTTAAPPPLKNLTAAPKPGTWATNSAPGRINSSVGSWQPYPVAVSRQWQRNGANIPGARGSSYSLTGSDYGRKVRLRMVGSKAGYNSRTVYSAEYFAAKVVNKPAYQYVNIRKSPTASSAYLGRIYAGRMIAIQCYQWGSAVTGPYSRSTIWYKIPGAGWVSEALLETNSNNPVVPRC
ncbi:M23 family metallopeptidase [Glutamicibacter sp. V16R2B1]|uniref:M23 family metallopeptidase n=1 Tax=unclassified Glutamicibacter TaxID=2627139 RepID=UPI001485A2D9|nr:M23 family metallopeptidase [Glutamicibacter sp. V16R2B1]